MDVAAFRQQMPICSRWAYFDHAAVSPLPRPAQIAVELWASEAAEDGDNRWPQWSVRIEQVRHRVAGMLGAHPDEIAFVPNTTSGISLVAEAFPWREGDNLIVPANEFPSNLYPWMNLAGRGVEARRVPLDRRRRLTEQLAAACDRRTRLVAISWVGYADGWRADLGELIEFAHSRGLRLLLDAIQGLGVLPIDVQQYPVDFLAADGHKWLLGPEGAGILYIRRDRLEELRPLGVGWHSVVQGQDFGRIELNLRPDAARYEGGSANVVGILALGASLDLLVSLGLSKDKSPLADHVLQVVEDLIRRIERVGGQVVGPWPLPHRSGIVSFTLPGVDPREGRRAFLEQGVVLSAREGRLRLSPHGYANDEDILRFGQAVERLVRGT